MSNIKLITVCSHPEYAGVLIQSAQKFGWDLHVEVVEWKGFGSKLLGVRDYLLAHPEVERFVFCDAFDVVVLGTPEEFESKIGHANMYVSAERGLWPPILHPFKEQYEVYVQYNGFNYLNSGLYYSKSKFFIELFEQYPPSHDIDDQYWMNISFMLRLFDEDDYICCDNMQRVFNSHSFISEGEYGYNNGRVQILGNEPIFIHSNGRSVDPKLDELVKEVLG